MTERFCWLVRLLLPRILGEDDRLKRMYEFKSWNGPEDILQRLSAPGWLQGIHWLDEVDSTNNVCKQLANEPDTRTPAIVVARRQTAGRGRRGRSWHSDSGSLTFSLLFSQNNLARDRGDWPQVALLSGLAICDLLSEVASPSPVHLKWPNDVYGDDGKLAGVLIESAGITNELLVVGIGINISTSFSRAPQEVADRGRSVERMIGEQLPTFDLLPEVVERLKFRLRQWQDRSDLIAEDFARYCMLTGCEVVVDLGASMLRGLCEGIDADGNLQVLSQDGTVVGIRSGEIIEWNRPHE